ncbi:MAG: nicotinate (nicotinamide) nucleotide adenylyltransferase [Chloroflexi bacterium]|nr:nicotinate (nicotinamide) nucleotide adenylyltransferase [Chloroflexota bacterium]
MGPALSVAVRSVVPGSLGILGGTFDPIHIGHLAVAEEARDALGLERITFVPAGLPPHKTDRPVSGAAHRLAMVELAIAGNPAFSVNAIELERSGPSFSVDTLEALAAVARSAGHEPDLVFILSAEAFRSLHTWRDPARILALARLAVVPRGGYPEATVTSLADRFPGCEDRAVFLDGPRIRLSASDLRDRAARGRSIRYLVPDAVTAYIGDHGLYADPTMTKD